MLDTDTALDHRVSAAPQVGIDMGGTKIEIAALAADGAYAFRQRAETPGTYDATIEVIRTLVGTVADAVGPVKRLGVGLPGSISPRTQTMRNANTTFLNGRCFESDLRKALTIPVRLTNDANCLALSEASDGAAAGGKVVFAVVIGTGVGGGLVVDGALIDGANGIAGEWGHSRLAVDRGVRQCWCGRTNCVETWVSGKALERSYAEASHLQATGEDIVRLMRGGDRAATTAFNDWLNDLAQSLSTVINVVDPDAIVFGGGLANVPEIYARLPKLLAPHIFVDSWFARLRPAKWGDSSGVRGAARL